MGSFVSEIVFFFALSGEGEVGVGGVGGVGGVEWMELDGVGWIG